MQLALFDGINPAPPSAEKPVLRIYADIKFEHVQEASSQNQTDTLVDEAEILE